MSDVAISRSGGLVPSNMADAMRLAEMMASAKLVPAPLQKSPADCLMVVMQAIRWQMDVFAVAQECSVIQGKLMHSGKLVAAVVNTNGNLSERLSFSYAGSGDAREVTVSGHLYNEALPRTVSVKLGDAKTNNKCWQTQPDQQLMYHGTRVWARRHTPELMLGVYSPEEFDEAPPMKRAPPQPAPLKIADQRQPPPSDPDTGEMGPRALPIPYGTDGKPNWAMWAQSYIYVHETSETLEECDAWAAANTSALEMLAAVPNSTKFKERLAAAVNRERRKFMTVEQLASEAEAPL